MSRLCNSAASTWPSQSRSDMPGPNPSRFSSEAATSSGLRMAITAQGSMPRPASTGRHSGSNRHRRGSFTTSSGAAPNSRVIDAPSRSRNDAATALSNQDCGKLRISCQDEPAAARTSSCRATISRGSQKPAALTAASASIKCRGSAAPHRLSRRASAEVPLRCMPSTRIARAVTPVPGPEPSMLVSVRDALFVEQAFEFARLIHLADDIGTTDEFAPDIELRNRRPVGELLDALPDGGVGQHVDALELHAEMAQHLHGHGREAALREDRRALHVEYDRVGADFVLDPLEYRVVAHRALDPSVRRLHQ